MNTIKILGINSSPRKYGNTYKLLKIALATAELHGATTETIHLYDYEIKPCEGCLSDEQLSCKLPCIKNDDALIILKKILEADALIISTPVYWYGPSGQLKNLIDRMTTLENMIFIDGKSWIEGKIAGVIAVGAESGAIMTISYLITVLNSMGCLIPPWALAYHQDTKDALENQQAIIDAANIGKIIVETTNIIKKHNTHKWYDPQILKTLENNNTIQNIQKEIEELKKNQQEKRLKIIKEILNKQPTITPPLNNKNPS